MPRSEESVKPFSVVIDAAPPGYVSVQEMKKVFGDREYNRLMSIARFGKIDSVKVVDNVMNAHGKIYVDPNTLQNLRKPNNTLLRDRMLAVLHGFVITEKMKFESKRHFSNINCPPMSELVNVVEKVSSTMDKQIIDAVDNLSVYSASPNSVQKFDTQMLRGERLTLAMERMVALQEETLAVAIESRSALQKLQQLWS